MNIGNLFSYALPAIVITAFIIMYTRSKAKMKRYLKDNPNKATIVYLGGKQCHGVIIYRILHADKPAEELIQTKIGAGGTVLVDSGEVTLEVENVTQSYALAKLETIYTHHGKRTEKLMVKAGQKYTIRFSEQNGNFFLEQS